MKINIFYLKKLILFKNSFHSSNYHDFSILFIYCLYDCISQLMRMNKKINKRIKI